MTSVWVPDANHEALHARSGNAHLRRVLLEAAWTYQHRLNVQGRVLGRQKALALSDEAKKIALKLSIGCINKRYTAMAARGKNRTIRP